MLTTTLRLLFSSRPPPPPPDLPLPPQSESSFSSAIETLQVKLFQRFNDISLLNRAMTDPSFSTTENNKVLSLMGASLIEASLYYMLISDDDDHDVSTTDLQLKVFQISNVNSCAANGLRLGLHHVVRVSPNTNSSNPSVVCDAFRALFAALAKDSGANNSFNIFEHLLHSGIIQDLPCRPRTTLTATMGLLFSWLSQLFSWPPAPPLSWQPQPFSWQPPPPFPPRPGSFSSALETLQDKIEFSLKNITILRRAMTDPSFSMENNKALSLMGTSVFKASLYAMLTYNDDDISVTDVQLKVSQMSNVNSCAANGLRLGLHHVVRVGPKTSSSNPLVVCNAFRALFAVIAKHGKLKFAEVLLFRLLQSGVVVKI